MLKDRKPRTGTKSWLSFIRSEDRPVLRLVCFPYAGGGAGVFRLWAKIFPSGIEIVSAQLPGRDTRINEKPLWDFRHVVQSISNALLELDRVQTVFFGHSFGSLIAFEVAKNLEKYGERAKLLILSGCAAPHISLGDDTEPIWNLRDELFIERIRSLRGTPDEVLNSDELLAIFLPILRSDFFMAAEARKEIRGKIDIPLVVFGGVEDIEVERDELSAWAQYTNATTEVELFKGDHFFINTHRDNVCSAILNRLSLLNIFYRRRF